jgi:Cu2+-containing amine oxidase
MNRVLHICLMVFGLLAILLAGIVLSIQLPAAQERGNPPVIDEWEDRALQPLTVTEIQQANTAIRSDNRARRVLAGNQRVRTIFVERYEEDKNAPTGQRRAHIVLYNYDTNETLSAVVTLEPRPWVDHLTVTKSQPPVVSTQEVDEAKQLALNHPTVRARLWTAGLAGRESELIITHLLARATAPDDPCSTHRCIALFFNTHDAVLGIEPIVDLTTGEVEIQ